MMEYVRYEVGAWIGAKCLVCPDVILRSYAVFSVQSVAIKDLENLWSIKRYPIN